MGEAPHNLLAFMDVSGDGRIQYNEFVDCIFQTTEAGDEPAFLTDDQERAVESGGGEARVFGGCVVYFDGTTGLHSSLHLSKLVMMHGGNCHVSLSKRSETRMPCTVSEARML